MKLLVADPEQGIVRAAVRPSGRLSKPAHGLFPPSSSIKRATMEAMAEHGSVPHVHH